MNKQIVVLSALLGVSLIGSYLSWTTFWALPGMSVSFTLQRASIVPRPRAYFASDLSTTSPTFTSMEIMRAITRVVTCLLRWM